MPDTARAPLTSGDPYAPFVPRRGRGMAYASAAAVLLGAGFVALALPSGTPGAPGWAPVDRVMIFALGALIAGFLYRLGSIRATPSPRGLTVRNVLRTTTISWAQIVRVHLASGAPWVVLELDDTDQLAVMAIQRADGQHAQRQMARLAALVQVHGTAVDPLA